MGRNEVREVDLQIVGRPPIARGGGMREANRDAVSVRRLQEEGLLLRAGGDRVRRSKAREGDHVVALRAATIIGGGRNGRTTVQVGEVLTGGTVAAGAPTAADFAIDPPAGVVEGVGLIGYAERGIVNDRAGEGVRSAGVNLRPFPWNAVPRPTADRSGVAEAGMLRRNGRREVHGMAPSGHGEARRRRREAGGEDPRPKACGAASTLVRHPPARGSSFSSSGGEETIDARTEIVKGEVGRDRGKGWRG